MTMHAFELADPEQIKEARRLLDLASAYPSLSNGVVMGQVTRGDWREPEKIILTLAVVPPDKAKRIERIIKA